LKNGQECRAQVGIVENGSPEGQVEIENKCKKNLAEIKGKKKLIPELP